MARASISNRAKWFVYLGGAIAYGIAFGEFWRGYLDGRLVDWPDSFRTIVLGLGLYVPMLILGSISVTYYNKSRAEPKRCSGE